MRKILLTILFVVLVVALFYKSPFSAMYNYNKARALYNQRQYEQSLPYFEKSLFADPKGILARFFYVLALSKSEPKYSIQKKLFEMANSKIEDEASKYAKSQTMYLRYKLLDGIENNYIFNAAMGSDILRWDIRSFPLSVYIDSPNSVPPYYIESINRAMNLWSSRTNFVKFKQAQNPLDADILIRVNKEYKDIVNRKYEKRVYTGRIQKVKGIKINNLYLTISKEKCKFKKYDTETTYSDDRYGFKKVPVTYFYTTYREYELVESEYTDEELQNILEKKIDNYIEKLKENSIQTESKSVNIRLYSESAVAEGTITTVEPAFKKEQFIVDECD